MTPATPNRRTALIALGTGLATAACSAVKTALPARTPVDRIAQKCVLTPEDAEGPYYVDIDLDV